MNIYAIFLRGVNVGGNSKINMNILKEALVKEKFTNVKTYLNSGNVILGAAASKDNVMKTVRQVIQSQFVMNISIIIKTPEELTHILESDPFNPQTETDHSKKMVVMLSGKTNTSKVLAFKEDKKIDENFYLKNDVLYIYYHNGAGRSKLTNGYIEKKLNIISTARNWNTMTKIREIVYN